MSKRMIGLALVLVSSVAFAAEPPAGGPPAGGPPPMPKPAPELLNLGETLVGNWKCTGMVTMGPAPAMKVTATYKITRDLSGFWLMGRMESPATKAGPGHAEVDTWGYNPASRSFSRVAFDNFGDMSRSTAAAWQNDALALSGTATAFGQEVPYQMTLSRKAPKELGLNALIGPKERPVVSAEYTCKR